MYQISKSAEQTEFIAQKIGEKARPGDVYCLTGGLGAGKTVFAKGFAKGLDVTEEITSPTFCIVSEYRSGRLPLYHLDVYRLKDEQETDDICLPDYFDGRGVCLIEWAENIAGCLPGGAVWISIKETGVDGEREIFCGRERNGQV